MKQGQSSLQLLPPLVLLAGAVLFASPSLGASSKPVAPSQPAADQAFAALVEKYLNGLHHFSPAQATREGFHQYDAELPDYSRRVIEAEIARVKACLADLDRIPKNSLGKENRFDARLLEGSMRGTADPTYLVYTLGKLQILKLREDYKKKVGDRFNLQKFHERFLGYGYPPVKLIREEMLGDDSPTL